MTKRTETDDSDDIETAVDETMQAIEQYIGDDDSPDEFDERLREAVEVSLRHSAELSGGYLRRRWIDEDDEQRYVVVDCDVEVASNTAKVLGDAGFDDAGILASFVHEVYENSAGMELDADEYVLVVPVPARMREVYW